MDALEQVKARFTHVVPIVSECTCLLYTSTLELRSDRAKRDVFFSPLKEILVYEDGKLLQSIDVPALMASDLSLIHI